MLLVVRMMMITGERRRRPETLVSRLCGCTAGEEPSLVGSVSSGVKKEWVGLGGMVGQGSARVSLT